MIKVTFTLDDDTVARLRRVSARLSRPRSQVVREAIRDYDERSSKLTEAERRHLLETFDRLVPTLRKRGTRAAEQEVLEIRAARRASALRRARRADR
jgi:predicted transcriptional regulator